MTPGEPNVTIVLPCFNEAERIGGTLEKIRSWLEATPGDVEVLVVDDGSADATSEAASRHLRDLPCLRVVRNETNRGKGRAVREGVRQARGRYVLFTDADLSTPIEEVPKLLERLDAGADLAVGSRRLAMSRVEIAQPWHRRVMGHTFVRLQQLLVGTPCSDTQCGFKAFRTPVARELFGRSRIEGFCFDVEILCLAVRSGLRIDEVPVRWRDDRNSRISPLRDAGRMLFDLLRIRWNLATGGYGALTGPARSSSTPPSSAR